MPHPLQPRPAGARRYITAGSWPLLLSYSAGLWLADVLPVSLPLFHSSWWSIAVVSGLWLIAGRIKPAAELLFYLLVVVLGISTCQQALRPSGTDLDAVLSHGPLALHGEVLQVDPQPGRWRMDVALERLIHHGRQRAVDGIVRIQVADNLGQPHPGDRVALFTKLRRPRRFGIPGEFNYPRHLADAGIRYSGFVESGQQIAIMPNRGSLPPQRQIARWRHILGQRLADRLHAPEYLLSLTLGQKSRLSPEQRQRLARLGLSHLFSISGLHLGLLAGLCYLLINRGYRCSQRLLRWQPAPKMVPLLTLPLILFYLLFSGSALPTQRAALLLVLGALILCRQRHTPPIQLLATVALLILLASPLALFSASFQLSFCGVAALMLCLPPWNQRLRRRWQRWVLLPPLATLVATLATAPIALHHFHQLAPLGLLSNLFAVPVIGLVTLPLALSGCLLFAIAPPLGGPLLSAAHYLIETCLQGAEALHHGMWQARLLYLDIEGASFAVALSLVALCLIARRPQLAGRIGLTGLVLWALLSFAQRPPAALQLTTLSVGQGEALLLQRGHENYLIDGGGLYSPTFDVGQRLLAPALGKLGVRHLNAVILTHDHPDHRKGLLHILRHFAVDEFWSAEPLSQLHWSLRTLLADRRIPLRRFEPGWTHLQAAPTALSIYVAPEVSEPNDRSLVIYAGHNQNGLLLTGDLEQAGVTHLLSQPLPGPVQVLKLPHHGSRHSHPERLLATLTPQWAIASAGYGNRYRFPHTQVQQQLTTYDVQLLRTDRDGSFQFRSNGQEWQLSLLAAPLPWP